jgi:hypothetical protein
MSSGVLDGITEPVLVLDDGRRSSMWNSAARLFANGEAIEA